MKIVSWNCRGLGGSQKLEVIKRFKSMESATILLLQETKKPADESLALLKSIWINGKGLAVSASGASGGLLCWWNSDKFELSSAIENRNWILLKLENKETKRKFWIGNVYGPTINSQKDSFWNSLEEQSEDKKLDPCFIAGDFNVTISAAERRGGSKVRDPFGERLEDLISHWALSDVKPKNGTFTWSNRRVGPGHIAARLDRFLTSTHLLDQQPEAKILSSAVSDHKPICLFFPPAENLGPLPFRFNRLWLESSAAKDLISDSWKCFIPGTPAYTWEQKLKRVKVALKSWAKTNYKEPEEQKKIIVKDMELLQDEMEVSEVTKEHLFREIELESKLQRILRKEEESWKLRLCVFWLKGGD